MANERARPWRLLASRVLLEHPRLTILEDRVVLPTGAVIDWVRFGPGPDFVQAVCLDGERRELREEGGVEARRLRYLGSFLAHRRRSAVRGHVFLATDLLEVSASPEEHELIDSEWLAIPEVERGIREGRLDDAHLLAPWTLFRLHCPEYF